MASKNKNKEDSSELNSISVLIVDDHQMVRDGIKVMLYNQRNRIRFVIDDAEEDEEALRKILSKNFDVVLLDYNLSGKSGAELLGNIMLHKPQTKVLALSNFDELGYVESMINAGARGYILKNIEPSQLISAIKTIIAGKVFYSNEIAVKLLEASQKEPLKIHRSIHALTQREIQVLKLICMEKTNEEIAEELFVSKRTIDTHRQNLLLKLQAKNTVGLIKAAYKLHLI